MGAGSVQFLVCLIAAGLLAGCGSQFGTRLAHAPEPSCGFFQSQSGYRVSWASRTPVQLNVSQNWPSEFRGAVQGAVDIWNLAQDYSYISVNFDSTAVGVTSAPDSLNGLYWMETWSEERSREQGVTTLRFKNDRATEADVRVNAKNFSFYDETPTHYGQVHMGSLLVHEFGHLLGMNHRNTYSSVMYPYLEANTIRVQLLPVDLESLICEYGASR
ncbi:MAG: matrixin family metalloprotease [Bdellovibrionales bacterium]